MRIILALPIALALLGAAHAADAPLQRFDISVNFADQRTVQLALTAPAGTTHRLQVDGDTTLILRPWKLLERFIEVNVLNTAGGNDRELGGTQRPPPEPGEVMVLSFSICGERLIALEGTGPGRCADLPSMAKPDRSFGTNGAYDTGPYEGKPTTITSHERIAPRGEAGEPLTLSGRVLGPDGKPRAGVIVYGYQTDLNGVYPKASPSRSYVSDYHGRFRGWARSDAQGRYTFDTIRPGSYGGNPQHIHMHVIEPGCSTYIIDELNFAGDPNLERMTPEQRAHATPGIGGSGVAPLRRKGDVWLATRDIHLGENVPGYEPCAVLK